MENYVAILLLIIPGFIAKSVYNSLISEKKTKSEFNETISALLFSVSIIFLNYIYFVFCGLLKSVEIKNLVNLFVPNCSSPLLNSGWNITIIAITPQFIIPVNIEFNIFKFGYIDNILSINISNPNPFCTNISAFSIFLPR